MLVLSRKTGQTVYIGEEIAVTILEVSQSGIVRLGFDAPRDVRIVREEVIIRGDDEYLRDHP